MNLDLPIEADHEWQAVVQELSLLKEEVDRLREEIGDVKLHFKQVSFSRPIFWSKMCSFATSVTRCCSKN